MVCPRRTTANQATHHQQWIPPKAEEMVRKYISDLQKTGMEKACQEPFTAAKIVSAFGGPISNPRRQGTDMARIRE